MTTLLRPSLSTRRLEWALWTSSPSGENGRTGVSRQGTHSLRPRNFRKREAGAREQTRAVFRYSTQCLPTSRNPRGGQLGTRVALPPSDYGKHTSVSGSAWNRPPLDSGVSSGTLNEAPFGTTPRGASGSAWVERGGARRACDGSDPPRSRWSCISTAGRRRSGCTPVASPRGTALRSSSAGGR
jgi:hypothetical protein